MHVLLKVIDVFIQIMHNYGVDSGFCKLYWADWELGWPYWDENIACLDILKSVRYAMDCTFCVHKVEFRCLIITVVYWAMIVFQVLQPAMTFVSGGHGEWER